MANNLKIVITASDRATATVRQVKAAISQFTKPIRDVRSSVGALAKETGLTKVGAGLSKLAGGFRTVLQNVTGMKSGILSLGVLGPGGVVAAIGAVTTAVVAMSREWAKTGNSILRSTQVLDIATDKFQTLGGAAEAFGLDRSAMENGLKSLGNTMEDALYGRNQQALMMMRRLGIEMHKTKNGSADAVQGLYDVADAIQRVHNVQAQQLIARTFGVESLLPMLQGGSKAVKEYEAQVRATGAVQDKEALESAARLTKAYTLLKLSVEGVGNALMKNLAPALISTADAARRAITGHHQGIADFLEGMLAASGPGLLLEYFKHRGAAPAAKSAPRPAVALPRAPLVTGSAATPAAQAMAFYQAKGWTREQAAALVGNLAWESHLNPGQPGDHGNAYGLAQWHKDRAEAFRRWSGHPLAGSSLAKQLAFSQFELTQGGEKKAGDALRGARTLADATRAVLYGYERPADPAASASQRLALAERFYGVAGGAGSGGPAVASTAPQRHEVEIVIKGLPAGAQAKVAAKSPDSSPVQVNVSLPGLATV